MVPSLCESYRPILPSWALSIHFPWKCLLLRVIANYLTASCFPSHCILLRPSTRWVSPWTEMPQPRLDMWVMLIPGITCHCRHVGCQPLAGHLIKGHHRCSDGLKEWPDLSWYHHWQCLILSTFYRWFYVPFHQNANAASGEHQTCTHTKSTNSLLITLSTLEDFWIFCGTPKNLLRGSSLQLLM